MAPLKVTIRPRSQTADPFSAIKRKLNAQLKKADEMEAAADKYPGTAKSRLFLADQIRDVAETKYFEAFTKIIDGKISGELPMRNRGSSSRR